MKHSKNKNGFWDFLIIILMLVFAAVVIFMFVSMMIQDESRIRAERTTVQKYAVENGLPPYITIERIRGCQYLESGRGGYAFSRTHMGDCDNPIHPYNIVQAPTGTIRKHHEKP